MTKATATTATVTDRIPLGTRRKTDEGFLRAGANLTRTGVLQYDASELGVGRLGETVAVMQTEESVFHPDTLASAQNAAVTIDHPAVDVQPDNWRALAVGGVASPRRSEEFVAADVMFGDRQAIETVEAGVDQLSVGKRFSLVPAPDGVDADFVTEGPIHINHVAVVEKGRAGDAVRVLDSGADAKPDGDAGPGVVDKRPAGLDDGGLDSPNGRPEEVSMDEDQMKTLAKAVGDAVKGAIPAPAAGDGADAPSADKVAAAVMGAIQPSLTAIDDMRKTQDAAELARAKEKQAEARDALKQSVGEAVAEAERKGYEAGLRDGQRRHDALALVGDANARMALADKPLRDVMVAAVGDMVPNAGAYSDDVLHGMLMAKSAQMDARQAQGRGFGGGQPAGAPDAGYAPFGSAPVSADGADAARGAADRSRQAWEAAIDRTFETGHVVQPTEILSAGAAASASA